ncbi:MAG: GYF domain-containing protein [Gemmataceae bacterium]
MPDWYYAKNGQQHGPISPTELKKLAAKGELTPNDLVFQEGGTKWVEASTVKGLFPPAGASKPASAPASTLAPAPSTTSPHASPPTTASGDDFVVPSSMGGMPKGTPPAQTRNAQPDADYGMDFQPPRAPRTMNSNVFIDFLLLRTFVTPTLVVVLFWLSVLLVIGSTILLMIVAFFTFLSQGRGEVAGASFISSFIFLIFISPILLLASRLWAEFIIVNFRMYEEMKAIRQELEKTRQEK